MILSPDPALNPVIPGSPVTVQLKVVVATADVRTIPVPEPEQIEGFDGVAIAAGIGFT